MSLAAVSAVAAEQRGTRTPSGAYPTEASEHALVSARTCHNLGWEERVAHKVSAMVAKPTAQPSWMAVINGALARIGHGPWRRARHAYATNEIRFSWCFILRL